MAEEKEKVDNEPVDTEAAAPPPPVETPPEPEKKTYQHPPALARLASDLGVPQNELDELPPEALPTLLSHLSKSAQQRAFEAGRSQGGQPPPSKADELEPIDWGVSSDGTKLSETDYAAPVAKTIRHSHEMAQQVKKLEAKLESQEKERLTEKQEAVNEKIDNAFASFPEELKHSVGEGRGADMQADDPKLQARIAILNVARADKSPGTPEQKMLRAAKKLAKAFGATEPENGKSGRITPEEWNAAGLAKPTQRSGSPEPKGVKRATKALAEAMKEKGIMQHDYDAELPE